MIFLNTYEGNYGTAHLIRDRKTGKKLVVKKIPLGSLTEKERKESEAESKLLKRLHHQNILEYVDSFLENDTLHIITQYCETGEPKWSSCSCERESNQPT